MTRRIINFTKEEIEKWLSEGKSLTALGKTIGVGKVSMCKYARNMGIHAKTGRPIGIPMSQEQKDTMSEREKGEKNSFYGKKHTEETRERMSRNHADFTGDKNPFKQSLIRDPNNKILASERKKSWWRNLSEENRKNYLVTASKAQAGRVPTYKMPNSKSGHYDSVKGGRVFYRSSWELAVIKELDNYSEVLAFDLEPFCIKYFDSKGQERYNRIDFFITFSNQEIAIIEVKPIGLLLFCDNDLKIKAQEEYAKANNWHHFVISDISQLNIDIKNIYEKTNNNKLGVL